MSTNTLCLIDGKNLVYSSHWVHRFLISKGRPTSVLFGGFHRLLNIAKQLPQTAFVFVWDGKGETWRHKYSNGQYKANRLEPNEDMAVAHPQIPIFKTALRIAGFRQFEFDKLEADDLIGILTKSVLDKKLFERVIIHSSDKDFYQLCTDNVGVLRGFNKEKGCHELMFKKEIEFETELRCKDWVKVRALIGDPTDNIPHVEKGLGPKSAIKLIQAGIDPSLAEFKDHTYQVRMFGGNLSGRWKIIHSNYQLSRIVTDVEDERLRETEARNIRAILKYADKSMYLREKESLGEERYASFTDFIVEYELNELFSQRRVLWQLP